MRDDDPREGPNRKTARAVPIATLANKPQRFGNTKKPVIDYLHLAGDLTRALAAASTGLSGASFSRSLHILVDLRTSQINGCIFCQELHTKEAMTVGESALRIQALAEWRNHDGFTPAERAALNWTELLTRSGTDEHQRDGTVSGWHFIVKSWRVPRHID